MSQIEIDDEQLFGVAYSKRVVEGRRLLDRSERDARRLRVLTREAVEDCGRSLDEWHSDLCDHEGTDLHERRGRRALLAPPWA